MWSPTRQLCLHNSFCSWSLARFKIHCFQAELHHRLLSPCRNRSVKDFWVYQVESLSNRPDELWEGKGKKFHSFILVLRLEGEWEVGSKPTFSTAWELFFELQPLDFFPGTVVSAGQILRSGLSNHSLLDSSVRVAGFFLKELAH